MHMKIKIADATDRQMAEFANVFLGLDVTYRDGRNKLLEKMEAAGFDADEIEVSDAPPVVIPQETAPKPQPKKAPVQAKLKEPGPKKSDVPTFLPGSKRVFMTINIPKGNGPAGGRPVSVGVNGRTALIKRAEDVDVPIEYVEVLKNAQRIQYDKDENGSPINPQRVPRYPFSIIRPPFEKTVQ